ncbi:hypothetical protein GG344DRAFT_64841 [Lentinula edodes]|nr:hypothetical protein GG344DRAFT_64841 [Lentinula edodes]
MLRLSMSTRTGVRGAPVFKYRFILICSLFSLFLFTAPTTAIPIAASVSAKDQERSLQEFNLTQSSWAEQPDVDHAISSGAQQSTFSKSLETREDSRREKVLYATLRFNGVLPSGNTHTQEAVEAQKICKVLVEELLTIASSVLHPTSPNAYFEVDKVIGYPVGVADHVCFSVSFTKQGLRGPEYVLYQGWVSWADVHVTGKIWTAGVKTLVASVEEGHLVFPKVFHIPFELGIRTKASSRRNKILDSDTKIML